MACPFFMPMEKFENGLWPHPGRLPLGCGWTGQCTAPGHEGSVPDVDSLHQFCNLGYAKQCSWLPATRSWDAVRFAVAAREENSQSPGTRSQIVQIQYVCERDHRPVEHGRLAFDGANAVWVQKHPDHRVQRMAECFLESCFAKRAWQAADGLTS